MWSYRTTRDAYRIPIQVDLENTPPTIRAEGYALVCNESKLYNFITNLQTDVKKSIANNEDVDVKDCGSAILRGSLWRGQTTDPNHNPLSDSSNDSNEEPNNFSNLYIFIGPDNEAAVTIPGNPMVISLMEIGTTLAIGPLAERFASFTDGDGIDKMFALVFVAIDADDGRPREEAA